MNHNHKLLNISFFDRVVSIHTAGKPIAQTSTKRIGHFSSYSVV